MISFEMANKGEAGILILDGDLTVQRAGELRAALMDSISRADNIVLNLERVTGFDLSCLQLLCAAHRSAEKLCKRLTVADTKSGLFRRVVEDAGYARHSGCIMDPATNCLWIGGHDG